MNKYIKAIRDGLIKEKFDYSYYNNFIEILFNVEKYNEEKERIKAVDFAHSARGKYIISQALNYSIKHLRKLEDRKNLYPKNGEHAEPSNRKDMEFLEKCNIGVEYLSDDVKDKLLDISQRQIKINDKKYNLLLEDDEENLSIE